MDKNNGLKKTALGMILALLFLSFSVAGGTGEEKLIYSQDSLYQRIMVYDKGPIRSLRFGAGLNALEQSVMNINDPDQLHLEFFELVFAGLLLNQRPEKALFIGLGGGVLPQKFSRHFPEMEIDIVEIDPEILKVAERYFFFQPKGNTRVHISDGRVFVRRKAREKPRTRYDLILLDAFNSEYIPFHLTTREFLRQASAILSPTGVVVANVFHNNQLFDAQLKTFLDVYGRCYVFMGTASINSVLIAPGRELPDLDQERAFLAADQLQGQHKFGFDLQDLVEKFKPGFQPRREAEILTDDLAPVNILRHRSREQQ